MYITLCMLFILKLTHLSFFGDLQIHDYPESWVWWVREKAISLILSRAVTPDDPDSPLPETTDHSKKNLPKKKGLPMYSPLKHKKSKIEKKSSKNVKKKSKVAKGKKSVPLRFTNLRDTILRTPPPNKATEDSSRPSGTRRKVIFEEHEDEATEGAGPENPDDQNPKSTQNPSNDTEAT